MFDLYKKRDLSAYITDTITFFKKHGKHFFKNYFITNGIFLLILVVLIFFISKIYTGLLFAGLGNNKTTQNYLLDYIGGNLAFLAIGIILVVLFVGVFSMLSYTFPVIYLQLFDQNNGTDFSTEDIISKLKSSFWKMFKFPGVELYL